MKIFFNIFFIQFALVECNMTVILQFKETITVSHEPSCLNAIWILTELSMNFIHPTNVTVLTKFSIVVPSEDLTNHYIYTLKL
jgi:hypothetical protein